MLEGKHAPHHWITETLYVCFALINLQKHFQTAYTSAYKICNDLNCKTFASSFRIQQHCRRIQTGRNSFPVHLLYLVIKNFVLNFFTISVGQLLTARFICDKTTVVDYLPNLISSVHLKWLYSGKWQELKNQLLKHVLIDNYAQTRNTFEKWERQSSLSLYHRQ